MHEELFSCPTAWRERIGLNCSTVKATGRANVNRIWQGFTGQRISPYAKLYTWFASFSTQFVVIHSRFVSIFDINQQMWSHYDLKASVEKKRQNDRLRIVTACRINDSPAQDGAKRDDEFDSTSCQIGLLTNSQEFYRFDPRRLNSSYFENPEHVDGQVVSHARDSFRRTMLFITRRAKQEVNTDKTKNYKEVRIQLKPTEEYEYALYGVTHSGMHKLAVSDEDLHPDTSITIMSSTGNNETYFVLDSV